MSLPKIVAESSIPYLKGALEQMGNVTYLPSKEFSKETVREADWLIIRSITKITPQLLEGSRVKLVTTATIGYDHIDTEYCNNNGIEWHNAPGCNAGGVGQYFGAWISLMALRGEIIPEQMTLGIVGAGHTGLMVAKYAEALGMKVLLNDPPRVSKEGATGFVSLETIAKEADIIEFHVPYEKGGMYPTHHLLNEQLVSLFQKRPIVANLCRGPVTDTTALLNGLENNKIKHLVLDCWENEPNISQQLLKRATIATPHIAGFSAEGKRRGAYICVEHGAKFFGLKMPDIAEPPAPLAPMIDLSHVNGRLGLYHAVLHTFDPRVPDRLLRNDPYNFERLRKDYSYPREPEAYTVLGSDEVVRSALSNLGFHVL